MSGLIAASAKHRHPGQHLLDARTRAAVTRGGQGREPEREHARDHELAQDRHEQEPQQLAHRASRRRPDHDRRDERQEAEQHVDERSADQQLDPYHQRHQRSDDPTRKASSGASSAAPPAQPTARCRSARDRRRCPTSNHADSSSVARSKSPVSAAAPPVTTAPTGRLAKTRASMRPSPRIAACARPSVAQSAPSMPADEPHPGVGLREPRRGHRRVAGARSRRECLLDDPRSAARGPRRQSIDAASRNAADGRADLAPAQSQAPPATPVIGLSVIGFAAADRRQRERDAEHEQEYGQAARHGVPPLML